MFDQSKLAPPLPPKTALSLRSARTTASGIPSSPPLLWQLKTMRQPKQAQHWPPWQTPTQLTTISQVGPTGVGPHSPPMKRGPVLPSKELLHRGCGLAEAHTASPFHTTDVMSASPVVQVHITAQQPVVVADRFHHACCTSCLHAAPHAQPLLRCSPSVAFTWRAHARRPPHTARGTTRRPSHRRPSHGRSTHVWGWGPSRSTEGWRPTHRAPEWRGAAHWTSKWGRAAVATQWPTEGGRAHHACIGNAAQEGGAGSNGCMGGEQEREHEQNDEAPSGKGLQ